MKKITLYLPLALALGLLTVVLLLTSPTTAAPPDALTPIYDIQYTTDPGDGTYPSPYEGQLVTTTGVVYAVYGGGFMIADDSGPWHSIYVYYPVTPKPELGDLVEVVGTVQEYYGLTELANYATYTTLSSGNPIHLPSIVTAAEIPFDNPDISEPYESVLVEVQNIVVTEGADPYCTWTFSDASSGSAKADDWGYCIDPDVGDQFAILRGALIYTFDWYRVMPRDAGDVIQGPHIAVQFHAASNVAPGALLTYTLSAINNTTISLTQVTITDAIPLTNTALADILDGGVLIGDVISWTIPNLPNGDIASVQFVVTATGQVGDEIWNRNYAAWAANWPTATVGGPYVTIIGDYTPIYQIQGDSDASPYDGYQVTTVGVVVGFFEGNLPDGGQFDGFFIQDPAGDGITTTSDGLFVNHGTLGVSVAAGDRVTVTGLVQEFSEWDGTACAYDCLTQIGVGSAGDVQPSITGTVAATLLDPPGDPDAAHIYWEALEGMLVSLPVTGAVVAPTNYGTIQVIPGDAGYDRALRGGPVEGMPVGVRHWKRFGEMGGGDPPSLIVGSVVTDVDGPLAYSYGSFLVATQPGGRWGVVYSQPLPAPPPSWLPAENSEFTLLSFNVENFFDTVNDPGKDDPVISPVNYAIHRDKIAATIAQAGCPTFVGLQEVEKLAVLQDVAAVLSTTYGCAYSAVLSEGLDGRGIDVGYLLDSRVTVDGLAQYQDCTEYDTGLGQGDCPEGQQMLYSRIPLVLTATVQMEPEPLQVVLIVNHLKSKLSRSGDPESAQWRLLQAESLGGYIGRVQAAHPDLPLIVLGDLNDFEDSLPLEALYSGGVTNTWYALPAEARYSYIYGGVSQILDHILASPLAALRLQAIEPLHYNADYPYLPYHQDGSVVWHTSDHDPLAATFGPPVAPCFEASTKSVAPTGTVTLNDLLVYTVTLTNQGLTATVVLTDELPPGLDLVGGFTGGGLVWSGTVGLQETIVLTLTARVRADAGDVITHNVALLDDGVNPPLALQSAAVPVQIYRLYLPLVQRADE